jgi:hypothetical protein
MSKEVSNLNPKVSPHPEGTSPTEQISPTAQRFLEADAQVQLSEITLESLKELGDAYQAWVKERRAK